jgi:Protein of unknown function (DUF2846)
MRLMARRLVLLLALALAAGTLSSCAKPYPDLQIFSAVEAKLPPPAHGQVRIYFYRLLSYYDVPDGTSVYLNDQTVGYSRIGTVFYRDVAPGKYFVSVLSRGAYPDQFKTIQVKPGQVWYIRIESLLSWSYSSGGGGISARGDTFTVNVVNPAAAEQEIQGLSYLPPG